MNGVKLIVDEEVIDLKDKENYSLENNSTNIALSFDKTTGFGVSVLNKETNILRYYNVVDSKLVQESEEDVMTGEEK